MLKLLTDELDYANPGRRVSAHGRSLRIVVVEVEAGHRAHVRTNARLSHIGTALVLEEASASDPADADEPSAEKHH